jgi:hypothetical protein
MLYLVALFIPPLAIILTGKIFQSIFNGILWLVAIAVTIFTLGIASGFGFGLHILCLIHAFFAINSHNQDKRTDRIVEAINQKGVNSE